MTATAVLQVVDARGTQSARPGRSRNSAAGRIQPASRTTADLERTFVSELPTIERAIAFIARRHRLNANETEELTSLVHVRMIDDDYAVLRKFEGRSALKTYLTVVIQRVFLDYRVSLWGKWRPSTQARREGATAILLERLTSRHNLAFDQACTLLETAHGMEVDRGALQEVYDRLPRRPRRHFVRDDALAQVPSAAAGADRLITASDRLRVAYRTSKHLASAIAQLPPEDRLILKLRFVDGLTMGEVGRVLSGRRLVEPKALYRRVRRMLDDLRAALERLGVDASEVLDALGTADVTMPRVLPRRPTASGPPGTEDSEDAGWFDRVPSNPSGPALRPAV